MAFRREGYRSQRLNSTNPYSIHTHHHHTHHLHQHSLPSNLTQTIPSSSLSSNSNSINLNSSTNSNNSNSYSNKTHRYLRHSEPDGPINEYGIYCGNLAWDVTSEMLKEHLLQIGNVISCEVFLNYDGRSKGSALARFETKESATRAIHELNDTDFRGRLIQVNSSSYYHFIVLIFIDL